MSRFTMPLVLGVLTGVLLAMPAPADDPFPKLPAEQRELAAKLVELCGAGRKAYEAGKYADAIKSFEEGLKIARRLYNTTDFPDGHSNLALILNDLGFLYQAQGKLASAEPLLKEGLEIRKRLHKGRDHTDLALSLNNLAMLYYAQGRLSAAEPLLKDALDMYKRLSDGQDAPDLARGLNNLAMLYHAQGKLSDAEPLLKDALAMYKRLHKGRDHADLALSLNNLAGVYRESGNSAAAEPLLKDALDMSKRLFKGQDTPALAANLSNLALLYLDQGKLAAAEPLFKDALEMHKRLFKGQDHPVRAVILSNLALVYREQGNSAAAESLLKDALGMYKRLFEGEDHPDFAASLNNLALLYLYQDKFAAAKPLLKGALEMRKRLYKGGDHAVLALSLTNLAMLYYAQGKLSAAEPLLKDALAMYNRLFKREGHLDFAASLNNLALVYHAQGKLSDAERLLKDALRMYRQLAVAFAQVKIEGETLTLLAQQPLTRDGFLSVAREHASDPADVYAQMWADKGYVCRAYERRLLQARAAATDQSAVQALADLTDARRRRAALLLAPATKDPDTLDQRKNAIEAYEKRIDARTSDLKALLPATVRSDKLDAALPADLQKALPAGAAVVDFLRFVYFAHNRDKPGKAGETRTPRYLAFVVTKGKVAWIDLGTAATIEPAVEAWRVAITGDSARKIPLTSQAKAAELGTKVRELVWAKVRKELPVGITTVYVCPDASLCRVPFAALPGDKPGTVVLEDFAVAMIPHAPFLLDKLWPSDERKNPPASALVVGAVKYDAELALPAPAPGAVTSGGEPLLKPDQKLGWGFLPNTAGEINGICDSATRKKLPVTRLGGDKATTAAVLSALPEAKYAHLATHGFFADPSFRSVFQLDEKDYAMSLRGERIGRAANSPLVMTGLVFAGANNPKTPGRGILTGEQLIDLDLSGLELAVLSACETGIGAVEGGEGTFGLQRAFHYAGTKTVVASLWKVPDQSTAALMALFYRNLWEEGLSPLESLRQAQLEIYKNPGQIPELAKGFRGKFEVVPGMGGEVEIKPAAGGKAHPLLWAAFTLSGLGR